MFPFLFLAMSSIDRIWATDDFLNMSPGNWMNESSVRKETYLDVCDEAWGLHTVTGEGQTQKQLLQLCISCSVTVELVCTRVFVHWSLKIMTCGRPEDTTLCHIVCSHIRFFFTFKTHLIPKADLPFLFCGVSFSLSIDLIWTTGTEKKEREGDLLIFFGSVRVQPLSAF